MKAKTTDPSGPRSRMLLKLKESNLTSKDADSLGLQPYTAAQSAALNLQRAGDGFRIPYYSPNGKLLPMFRYRYFETALKNGFLKGAALRKYDQPRDTDAEVYFPRLPGIDWAKIIKDTQEPLHITEGELKSACATKMGFTTIGLGGVYNFASYYKAQTLIPSLQEIEWRGREVFICYDSDASSNHQVIVAESRLARVLTDQGAFVRVVRLPALDKQKTGLDDYLVKLGEDEFDALRTQTPIYAEVQALHLINEEAAYIVNPSMVALYPGGSKHRDDKQFYLLSPTVFANEVYANVKYTLKTEDKITERKAAKDWLEWKARAEFQTVCYEPGKERVVDRALNMWQGWGTTPQQGNVKPFLELFNYMFANAKAEHREWLMQWFAYPIKNPGVKLYSAVVVWSQQQGVGKTLLGETLGRIYGSNYGEVNNHALQSSFNSWSLQKQFIMGDEITGTDSREVADKLKNMITGTDLLINEKYKPEYRIRNCINYYFTSNHPNAFFINDDDRRYFVHQIETKPLMSFFTAYKKWLEEEHGAEAVHWYLLNKVALTSFEPTAAAPRTLAHMEMAAAGRSEPVDWAKQLKDYPDNMARLGKVVIPYKLFTLDELMDIYHADQRRKPVSSKSLSLALREAGFQKAYGGQTVPLEDGRMSNLWIIRETKLPPTRAAIGEFYAEERRKEGGKMRKYTR